jgi:tetratricopeptide (TPR) repeat protein
MVGEHEIQKAYESILSHDFEKAIAWFEKAIAVEPDNAAYHYKLSITYARSNKLKKAIDHAEEAVRIEPQRESFQFHLQALHARSMVQEAEGWLTPAENQPAKAIHLLKKAILLDPLRIEAYLILAVAYASENNYLLALATAHEALRLDPFHVLAKQLIKEYQVKQKET